MSIRYYCTADDNFDTLIKITDENIEEATRYVESLAASLGVTAIVSPTPYEVKMLALNYACARRALYLSGKSPRSAIDGDAYQAKYKMYVAEAAKWESRLTAELLSGTSATRRTLMSIPMFRS